MLRCKVGLHRWGNVVAYKCGHGCEMPCYGRANVMLEKCGDCGAERNERPHPCD